MLDIIFHVVAIQFGVREDEIGVLTSHGNRAKGRIKGSRILVIPRL